MTTLSAKFLCAFAITIALMACGKKHKTDESEMIPLAQIEGLYESMHGDGINTDQDMLYGYFFTNSTREPLEKLSAELQSDGYTYVDIYPDDSGLIWLHVERIETHDAASLFERNKKMYALADEYDVDKYDGFDLGNPDGTSGIERDETAVAEEFQVAQTVDGGYPCFITCNTAFDRFTLKDEYRYFVVISCKYKSQDDTGFPAETDMPALDSIEERSLRALDEGSVKNYYVYRKTSNNLRKVYIVTNDSLAAIKQMETVQGDPRNMTFTFEVVNDPYWGLYDLARKNFQ
jgi:hypothetical protein